jgi:hypothetical protein
MRRSKTARFGGGRDARRTAAGTAALLKTAELLFVTVIACRNSRLIPPTRYIPARYLASSAA